MSDTITVKGFVTRMFEKSGTSAKGKWTAYSCKLVDENGTEDERWFRFGFKKPPFKSDFETDGHGDYVQFDVQEKGGNYEFVQGTGKVVKNCPARSAKDTGGKGKGTGGGYQAAKTTESALFGEIGGYNTEDDIRRMSYSAARKDAVDLISVLIANNALPLTAAGNAKANIAKRFEEVLAAVDKVTVEFFYDAATGRKLETVADAGEVEKTATSLPDDADEGPEDEGPEPDDELPPADPDEGDDLATF